MTNETPETNNDKVFSDRDIEEIDKIYNHYQNEMVKETADLVELIQKEFRVNAVLAIAVTGVIISGMSRKIKSDPRAWRYANGIVNNVREQITRK